MRLTTMNSAPAARSCLLKAGLAVRAMTGAPSIIPPVMTMASTLQMARVQPVSLLNSVSAG